MATKDTAGEKDAARRKLKLNKETVKDLDVRKGAGDAVKGAAQPPPPSDNVCAETDGC
jgi:hypothetical protein